MGYRIPLLFYCIEAFPESLQAWILTELIMRESLYRPRMKL